MGRIVVQVEISNPLNGTKPLVCSMFVDTGAAGLVLPMAWKDRLGKFANQEKVEIVQGFRKIFNEVTFMEMEKGDSGDYEPLLGYVVLEQAQIAVDMVGHRLVPIKYVDCK